jgi:ABC-2 type transport system permease protein
MVEVDDLSINDGKCNLYFKKFPSETVQSRIRGALQESLERFRVTDSLKLDYETYKRARVQVSFQEINIERLGETDRTREKAIIGFGFAILIYLFIFLYGVQVMRGVIEEKTNRIVEVIVSSVKPFQLMMGKVIGIGLVGLTQFLMWVVLSGVVSTVGLSFFASEIASGAAVVENAELIQSGGMDRAQLTEELMRNEAISWFFQINWAADDRTVHLLFHRRIHDLRLALRSHRSRRGRGTDTQQFMLPITLPLVFSYIVSATMLGNPESPFGTSSPCFRSPRRSR